MVHKNDQQIIAELIEMGFDSEIVKPALIKCNYNKEDALNYILTGAEPNRQLIPYGPNPNPAGGIKADEDDISKAIAMSLEESNSKPYVSEQKEREPGVPVGLKTTGNIGFFNSLLQIYYSIPPLRKTIQDQRLNIQSEDIRKKKTIKLISEMSSLFNLLENSKLKFEDPKEIINALIDIDGTHAVNNEQTQISDFSMKFIARIEEGLKNLASNENEEIIKRKDSISFLTEDSIISNLFCGTSVNFVNGRDLNGAKVENTSTKTLFGKIELPVDGKELYEAWSISSKKKLDSYVLPSGSSIKAKQKTWIENLPGVLMFEINRHGKDSNGNIIKQKKPFSFPKLLYPGRFLLKNRKKSQKLQRAMAAKKKKVKQLETSIETFEKFNGSDLSLEKMLKLCSVFLNSQKIPTIATEEPEIEIHTPSKLLPQEDLEVAVCLIDQYTEKVSEKIQVMKNELLTSTNDIENTFNQKEFNEHVYELSAIIVHDGDVGSGQYYLYMRHGDQWKKYHDINVTDVNEKQVMFDALGEYGICAASCLVYIDQGLIKQ
jgi:Ubiquitin carboxyl-terminal hydrolase/UBA/TS-N domain